MDQCSNKKRRIVNAQRVNNKDQRLFNLFHGGDIQDKLVQNFQLHEVWTERENNVRNHAAEIP